MPNEHGLSLSLRNGQQVKLRIVEPPVENPQGVQFWWRGISDRWMRGDFTPWCRDRAFIAAMDDDIVGSITLMTPRDGASDVGAVEFVWTREDVRGNGIATFLLKHLVDTFQGEGGKALFLCTINPVAYRIYQSLGFRSLVGDGMRCLAPDAEDFDDSYFAKSGPARVREANWGDMARFAALYNWPRHRCFIKDRSKGVFADFRFESHFNEPMLAHEAGKGLALVLENLEGRVVGACLVREGASFYEQHTALLDFLVVPSYAEQATDLLQAAISAAAEKGWALLLSHRADGDEAKETILSELGFTVGGEFAGYFRDGKTERSLRIWHLGLPAKAAPARPRANYYGGLPRFLEEGAAAP